MDLLQQQINLEKQMTQNSIDSYRSEYLKAKQKGQFGNTVVANKLLSRILDDFSGAIRHYYEDYSKGKAVRSTITADVISRLRTPKGEVDIDAVAYIASKMILNSLASNFPTISMYKSIGQGLEDEFKMREFKEENSHYYETIQKDLNRKGAAPVRKKNILTAVFNHRLDFHLERWTQTEKFQTGLVLTKLFIDSTGLAEYEILHVKYKTYKLVNPTQLFVDWIEEANEKLELLQPLFLPMVCPPKPWTSVLDGGYISPYIKKNKLVKNNSKEYIKKLETADMPLVYEAVNHLQATAWQINTKVLDVVSALWEEGKAIAELPDREDEPLIPFPYPELGKGDPRTEEQAEVIKKWKRDTYDIHKRNVQRRSVRILVSQILRIANQFKGYESIYFPHQMDFRGRLYPIPVLLQPQGTDLAKGLLQFARGKPIKGDDRALRWLMIQGANTYGYDKESYDNRIRWVKDNENWICDCANNPLENRRWTEADKPFQFLAWCFEYSSYLSNPSEFLSHIPIQLDGTCNGLQHYSALLRDLTGGCAVNLVNSDKPNDIYAVVATRLEEKLNAIITNSDINSDDNSDIYNNARNWLNLGINRKLTKRPVMVLPYGGTLLSCREYIQEYLTDTYSPNHIWKHFGIGETPAECMFKVSVWLSKYLWEAIQETLKAATVGMSFLRKTARVATKHTKALEWLTPAGLLVRQAYPSRKRKEITTELYGSTVKCMVNIDQEEDIDIQRQLNGICPNFIHSLDASCLMLYLNKCKQAGIDSFMTVHDCYGVHASDTETSARLLREAFVEIYRKPILENFVEDITQGIDPKELPELPPKGELDIEEVLKSEYFFN